MASSEHCRPSASIVSPCVSMAIESRGTGLVGLALTLGAGIRCGCDRRLAQPHAGLGSAYSHRVARPTDREHSGNRRLADPACCDRDCRPGGCLRTQRRYAAWRRCGTLAPPRTHRKVQQLEPGARSLVETLGRDTGKVVALEIKQRGKVTSDRDRRLGHARENVLNTSLAKQQGNSCAVKVSVTARCPPCAWRHPVELRQYTTQRDLSEEARRVSIRWMAAPTTTGSRAGGRARAESSGERAMRPRPRRADPTVSRRRRTGT